VQQRPGFRRRAPDGPGRAVEDRGIEALGHG
jgi:hypothetical protein